MAVQFNLLPDVKLEFNRQQHAKRVVYALSTIATVVALVVFIVSYLSVNILQSRLLSDANNDINNYSQKLKAIPNLDKILTIQNQLNSLPGLHQQKHYSSRLLGYLPNITPTNVNIGKLDLDTTASTVSISGTADKVETVNKFVDTLKFTTYKSSDGQTKNPKAFSNVILTKVDRDDKQASYTIDATFDPALFIGSKSVTLVIPNETTTRSILNTPDTSSPLFNGQTGTKTNTTNQSQSGTQ